MAGINRIVNTSFWTDGKVEEFTPEDKYFMLYLLTNPHTTQLGIYEVSVKRAAYEMGYSQDAVRALLERFECVHGMIIYSKATNEVAVKNFLRHSIIKGGAPVRDCLIKEMKAVKNRDLIARVFAHIKGDEKLNATVRSLITEYEEKNGELSYSNSNEKENENENDNENEVSYHDTGTNRSAPKAKRHKYGEYDNVLLTDEEFHKLQAEFPQDWKARIDRLSGYIASTGKSYKNHLATIRNWARKDKEQAVQQGTGFETGNPFLEMLNERRGHHDL